MADHLWTPPDLLSRDPCQAAPASSFKPRPFPSSFGGSYQYETYDDVLAAVPRFIDEVYNAKRMHSSLCYWAPDEYEQLWEAGEFEKLGIDPSFKLKGKLSN